MVDSTRTRLNTTLAPEIYDLLEDRAQEWGVSKGEALDRLIKRAAGTEAAARQAEAGLDALEELNRRLLGDYTTRITATLKDLLDGPHIEATTARLLLFALLCHLTTEKAAIASQIPPPKERGLARRPRPARPQASGRLNGRPRRG